MATEDPTPRNDSLMKNLMGYIDTRIDLVRLEVQEKVKTIFVGVAQGATLAILGLLFVPATVGFIGYLSAGAAWGWWLLVMAAGLLVGAGLAGVLASRLVQADS